jgi:uncharacterized protein (TIGR02757 family)
MKNIPIDFLNKTKDILDEAVIQYNNLSFIESDPISIPHRFSKKEDVEISGLMAATFAWGNRKTIIKSSLQFLERMDMSPWDFILNHSEIEKKRFLDFKHRTFNADDALFFIEALSHIYKNHGGLEAVFFKGFSEGGIYESLVYFNQLMFSFVHSERSRKHVSNPAKGSACKRLNMFLRWMVRKDDNGVDFGIWNKIPMSSLLCPLDVHSGNTARNLGILTRKQNDWCAVLELNEILNYFCPQDPAKYDFALFGLSINNNNPISK